MSIIWRIFGTALLLISCSLILSQDHPFNGPKLERSHSIPSARDRGSFGQPVAVETGTEEIPSNQGFLNCATQFFHTSIRHSSTDDLVTKLQSNSSLGDRAVIVGHGAPGIMCTGDGDHCSGNDLHIIAASNASAWQPIVQKLYGKFAMITLVGCVVGQGAAGMNLLSLIANSTNAKVRAPDGVLSCGPDGIEFFGGSGNWIQVDPSSSPVIQSTSPPPSGRLKEYKFMLGSSFVSVSDSDVELTNFQHRGYDQKEFRNLNLLSARSLLPLIDFANPMVTKQRPGAIVTGKIGLRVRARKHIVVRNFILYNDEWFEDRDNLDVFYHATGEFSTALTLLLR